MYIRRIIIDNVRGFGEGQIDLDLDRGGGRFAGWTVIAGRNGSGKSTLLRAVALAAVGPRNALRLQDSYTGWVHEGANHAKVFIEVEPTNWDAFEGAGNYPGHLWLPVQLKKRNEGPEPVISEAPDVNPRRRKMVPGRGPWSEYPMGWFLAGYGPFRRLFGQTVEAQRVMTGPRQTARLATLFREDASLLESLAWLGDLRLRDVDGDKKAGDLLKLAYAMLNEGLLPDDTMRVIGYDADGLWVRRGEGVELPLRDLSDGYRAIAALVLDLLRALHACYAGVDYKVMHPMVGGQRSRRHKVDNGGVVLIDEIDAHLHVSWQQRIGPWLCEHFPNIQFLVTSHSPFVCQSADKRGLILLPPPGSDEKACVADDALWRRVTLGSVDEALLSRLFGMEHTWSPAAEEKHERLASLEARVLSGKATRAELASYQQLRTAVPTTMEEDIASALKAAPSGAKR